MTVSSNPRLRRRGGATAYEAKITSPIAPEMNMALRSNRKSMRWYRWSQMSVIAMTGQWPQM